MKTQLEDKMQNLGPKSVNGVDHSMRACDHITH